MKKTILFLFIALSFSSCKKDNDSDQGTKEEINLNVSYGTDNSQKMDVYLPANRTATTPLVLMLHGGAWIDGDKAEIKFIQDSLLKHGIASVNMNYRFASATNHFEGMMEDVGKAFAYVKQNADDWTVRSSNNVVLGVSAGAHIALLYAYAYKQSNEVSAVISLCGPTIFTEGFLSSPSAVILKTPIEAMVGAPITSPLTQPFTNASPALRITSIPTLLIHGTSDIIVPFESSNFLSKALESRSIPNKLVRIEGAGHDLGLANPAAATMILKEVLSWITIYSK
ncbi:alpha/beta hydrolase [Arcticibacter eurypsychrophilus]|uniref:alpha/beta hydrolase n=1 Tax=Arcticibacter eurypsychrophilus TaxID=1434752 RepID=UPI00084DBEA3|nr:alpha/beta hydrolase [Arcticibacter eurypsychrophilus]